MKILFYCQHVLGIGHFFRSMEIARALHGHNVLFVGGGNPLEGFTAPGHVASLYLPALTMDPEFSSLHAQDGTVEEIKETRGRTLLEAFDAYGPDLILTELFPFGRRQFRFELMPILKAAKERSRPPKIVCSLRDILVEKKEKPNYESEVLEILNKYYDLLLIHSDPDIIRLDETFSLCPDIRIPVEYTGFVARACQTQRSCSEAKTIVVSSGGGRVGVDLLCSAIEAVRKIYYPNLQLRVFLGPFMDEADKARIRELASTDTRIHLLPFSLDFLSELANAHLSISMAGYNTCMDILSSSVPALVYPFPQNREQGLRAAKLERARYLKILTSLDPGLLGSEIESILEKPHQSPTAKINLLGAGNSARMIAKLGGCN